MKLNQVSTCQSAEISAAWVIIDRAVLCIGDCLLDDFVMWQWTVDYYLVDKMPTLFTTD